MRPSDLFRWKTYFYHGLLPTLRRLGPARADTVLDRLGRLSAAWPSKYRGLARALAALHASGISRVRPDKSQVSALAAGALRFIARDYLLETPDDAEALARFDVSGGEAFDEAIAAGRGVILVGGHYGAHLAALHWLFRRGVPLRAMVQRPTHVSKALLAYFDRDAPLPQSGFFLRRGLGPADCVERLLRVRAAVRSGMAVYFAGDIPWTGPNTRAGRLLGQTHRFLAVWADLSALTGAPVFHVIANHRPGGRFALALDPAGVVVPGAEDVAVARYLTRLESAIAADPADAPAHLLWPCYSLPLPAPAIPAHTLPRPSHRASAVSC